LPSGHASPLLLSFTSWPPEKSNSNKKIERDDESKRSHHALAGRFIFSTSLMNDEAMAFSGSVASSFEMGAIG
jgi:hypothetical protein